MNPNTAQLQFTAREANGQRYIAVSTGQIQAEDDALELVSACAEHDTNLVLLPQASLSADFLRLSTRVAGLVLGKLMNYGIKAAAVYDATQASGALADFLLETNQGRDFRVYPDESAAVAWLTT